MTIAPAPPPARSLRRRLLDRGRDQAGQERAVLVLHDVMKQYPNGKIALRDVDLVIPEGDFVFLVGPSGRGQVHADQAAHPRRDRDARRRRARRAGPDRLPRRQVPRMRRKIGIIFQDFKLLPTKTVWENVAFALEVTGHPRRQIRPAVDRVLAIVGLTAQAQADPVAAVRRRAAADGHRARPRPRPAADHRRRTHGQPGSAHQLGDPPAAAAHQRTRASRS